MMSFCRIWSADVSPLSSAALFAEGYRRMPPERQAKIDRLKFEDGKRLSLGAGLLLQTALASVGLDLLRERMETGPCGKPFLPAHPKVRFNLSHADTRVLCVLSDLDCGCDVELIGRGSPAIAARFFSPEEQRRLEELGIPSAYPYKSPSDPAWQRLFCRIWTRKESWLKATGEGLFHPLNSFSVFAPPSGLRFLEAEDSPRTLSCVCLLTDPAGGVPAPEPLRIPVDFSALTD